MPRTDHERHNEVVQDIAAKLLAEAQEVSPAHAATILESATVGFLGATFNSGPALAFVKRLEEYFS